MPEYERAPAVAKVAQDVIDAHHHHLVCANIVYLFRSPPALSKGRVLLGKALKATALHKAIAGDVEPDFIIEISLAPWMDASPRSRRALVDHELCHCVGAANSGFDLRGHDVEEFAEIVRRHGAWKDDLVEFKAALAQLELFPAQAAQTG